MAWNPSPEIADLRLLSVRWNADQIIAIAIKPSGQFAIYSYGKTRQLCDEAKAINEQIGKLLEQGTIKT